MALVLSTLRTLPTGSLLNDVMIKANSPTVVKDGGKDSKLSES